MSGADEIMKSKSIVFTDPNTKHDRVLIVYDEFSIKKKFYIMSRILSHWSKHFADMFNITSEGAKKDEIELKDLNPESFEEFLKIIYDSKLSTIRVDLLIPLIDLSFRFLSSKVLDACKSYVGKSLGIFEGSYLVKLLDKSCERDIKDMKVQIINCLKIHASMNVIYGAVIDCSTKHKLDDLKDWTGNYLVRRVTPANCDHWLDYSVTKNLPTLKAGILKKIATWEKTPSQPNYYGWYQVPQHPIPEDNIIGLLESAFKHDVAILKDVLRKRIFSLVRSTNHYGENGSTKISVNTFLEKNLAKIYSMKKDIREFILTSTIRDI